MTKTKMSQPPAHFHQKRGHKGGGLKKGKPEKRPSVKNVIRSLTRLLAKPVRNIGLITCPLSPLRRFTHRRALTHPQNLPAEMRVAKEAQLASLQNRAQRKEVVKKEQSIASKYHKVKFVERQKVSRRLKRVQAALQALSADVDDEDDVEDDDEDDDEAVADQQDYDVSKFSAKQLKLEAKRWQADLDYIEVRGKYGYLITTVVLIYVHSMCADVPQGFEIHCPVSTIERRSCASVDGKATSRRTGAVEYGQTVGDLPRGHPHCCVASKNSRWGQGQQ